MNIKLTPEIERVLIEIAEIQGTTAELLAIRTFRECFFPKETEPVKKTGAYHSDKKSLADLLAEDIGSIDSGEIAEGGARMSENTGKRFGEILSGTEPGRKRVPVATAPSTFLRR